MSAHTLSASNTPRASRAVKQHPVSVLLALPYNPTTMLPRASLEASDDLLAQFALDESNRAKARALQSNDAEQQFLDKLMRKKQRAEQQRLQDIIINSSNKHTHTLTAIDTTSVADGDTAIVSDTVSDAMLAQIQADEIARLHRQMNEEEQAKEKLMEKLKRGKAKRRASVVDMDTGTTTVTGGGSMVGIIQDPEALASFLAITAARLSIDSDSVASMSVSQIQAAMISRGLDVDVNAMIQAATDSEAAIKLAAQRASDEAELRMIRKLLARKNLNDTERSKLLDRERISSQSGSD